MATKTTRRGKYQTVQQKVKSIVEKMVGKCCCADVQYMFNDWATANVDMDKVTKPTIMYVLPPSGELNFRYGEVKDKPETQMAFLCTTDFDFGSEENDGVVEQMKRLLADFVVYLNRSGLFEPIEGDISYQVVYDYLDDNVTGVIATLVLKELNGLRMCATSNGAELVYPEDEFDEEAEIEASETEEGVDDSCDDESDVATNFE